MELHFFRFVKLWILLFAGLSVVSIWTHRATFCFRLTEGLTVYVSTMQNALPNLWMVCVMALLFGFLIRLIYH